MPDNTLSTAERDPRVDPMAGDRFRIEDMHVTVCQSKAGIVQITSTHKNRPILAGVGQGTFKDDHIGSQLCTLRAFRRWARNAKVISEGEPDGPPPQAETKGNYIHKYPA
jgi:hypothetical protein